MEEKFVKVFIAVFAGNNEQYAYFLRNVYNKELYFYARTERDLAERNIIDYVVVGTANPSNRLIEYAQVKIDSGL